MNLAEITLVLLIGLLWIFSIYGYRRLWVDAAYIYLFPFVAIYNTVRIVVKGVRFMLRSASKESDKLADSIVVPTISIKKLPETPKSGETPKATSSFHRALMAASVPIRRFAPLWWLLVWLASKPVIVWIATAAVMLHLLRAVVLIFRLSFISIRGWMERLEGYIRTYTEGLIAKLLGINLDDKIENEAKSVVSNLAGIKVAIGCVGRAKEVGLLIFGVGVCLFLAVHIYLAAFFTFAYLAVARLQSIPYGVLEGVVTALFMPLTFDDLPKDPFMKILGGMQCLLIIILGAGEVFAYFQRKVETLQRTALQINQRLDDAEIRTKLEEVQKRINA